MKGKNNLEKIRNKKSGIVLIAALLIMVLLSALAAFFIGSMLAEFKIATSNRSGIVSFYVAESGIEEAIFKVKNDATVKAGFQSGTLNYNFSRNPYLVTGSSYDVLIQSLVPGEAEITSTGKLQAGILTAQRVVKTKLVKATNPDPAWDSALYGSRDIDIFGSAPDITGDLYAANDIDVWGFSHVDVTGNVYAGHNILVWLFSQLDVTGEKRAENYPPEPPNIEMPIIDFDSANPNSLKNLANQVYTQQQFKNLLNSNQNLTLNGITYVTGNIDLKQTRLTVNGVLVADGNIDIGMTFPGWGNPNPTLTVTHTGNEPSGIFAKSKIKMGVHARDISVDGLIYCLDEFRTFDFGNNLYINGGIIAGEVALRNLFSSITFNYDPSRIAPVLDLENEDSPAVQIEHWEESY